MKNLKYIFLIIILLFISGCTTTYELEIDGDNLKEKITTYIYDGDREADRIDSGEDGNRLDAFINSDQYPFFETYDHVYKKKVSKESDFEKVVLTYDYEISDFENSNALYYCFESSKVTEKDESYNIKASGYFYCKYINKNIDIIINSKNKVIKHNADEVDGHNYIWHITKDNFKDTSINIEVAKKSNENYFLPIIVLLIIVIVVIGSIIYVFIKKKNNEKF